ncbi:MAG: hypothetical protein AAF696_21165, partial [Bacteroidota bacterium]
MKKIWNLFRSLANMNPSTKITLFDQAIVSGSNFFLAILLTRLSGLDAYGYFALGWLLLLFISSLQQAFIMAPMMSLAPKKKGVIRESYLTQSQIVQVLFTASLFLLMLGFVFISGHLDSDWDLRSLFPELPLATCAYLMQDYYRRYFFIESKAVYALIIDILAYPGMLLAILILYFVDALSIEAAYSLITASFGLAAAVGAILAKIPLSFGKRAFSSLVEEHLRFSSWLLGTALLQFFSSNYFLLAAAALMGTTALGALRIAQNLLGLTHVLFQAMENVVPVKAAQAFAEQGFQAMSKYLTAISLKSGLVICGILLGLALFSQSLLSLVYGQEYAEYAFLLMGYCFFYLCLFPGYPLRYALR